VLEGREAGLLSSVQATFADLHFDRVTRSGQLLAARSREGQYNRAEYPETR
jgi:hypothetical protein